ncbi:MAG: hypothetical protein E6G97_22890 [Alphaproteobacteria bacterium]|nr:MAG: hypothetical protein E6G97_22890 [Alphaproteobacteria bacterium]
MWWLLAALAFAGALCSHAPARAGEAIQVAQMSRDVTDAVRRQRAHGQRLPRVDHHKREDRR